MLKSICILVAFLCFSCAKNEKVATITNPLKIVEEIDIISQMSVAEFNFDPTNGPGTYRYKKMIKGSFLSKEGVELNYVKLIGPLKEPVAFFYSEPFTPLAYLILLKETSVETLASSPELRGLIGKKVIDRVYIYHNR